MKQKFREKGCDFGDFVLETMIFLLLNTVSVSDSVLYVFQKNGHGWVNIVTFVPMQGPYTCVTTIKFKSILNPTFRYQIQCNLLTY